jgi:heat shock protein HtpX
MSGQSACPDCGAVMPVHKGYVTWCDGCDWNVNPRQVSESRGPINEIRRRLGLGAGERLFKKLAGAEEEHLRPRLTPPLATAYVLSALVHLITLALLVIGIVLPIRGWPNPFAVGGGLVSLALVWALRPRVAPMPKQYLAREDFPELYRFVDRIAARLGLVRIDAVGWNATFNASFGIYGFRRRTCIIIGLPLFEVLNMREKEALIGHEVAHGVNGDVGRSFMVGSAVSALQTWYMMIMPTSLFESPGGVGGLLHVPMNLIRGGIAQIIRGYLYLILSLLYHEGQRAEYLADYLGASIAGSDGMVGTLNKFHYDTIYGIAAQRAALNRESGSMLEELHAEIALMPAREALRLTRIARAEGSKLDDTHPPTPYRIEFLERRQVPAGPPVLSPEEERAFMAELARLHPKLNHAAVERYRRFATMW